MRRLYANENFPLPVVLELRHLGHDVLTIAEMGKAGQSLPDEAVLAFARADRRAVLTLNRKHFVHLHGAQREHEGIIVCTFDPDFTGLANRIHAAIQSGASLAGQLIRVNRPTP
jgi:hypothetical protein